MSWHAHRINLKSSHFSMSILLTQNCFWGLLLFEFLQDLTARIAILYKMDFSLQAYTAALRASQMVGLWFIMCLQSYVASKKVINHHYLHRTCEAYWGLRFPRKEARAELYFVSVVFLRNRAPWTWHLPMHQQQPDIELCRQWPEYVFHFFCFWDGCLFRM